MVGWLGANKKTDSASSQCCHYASSLFSISLLLSKANTLLPQKILQPLVAIHTRKHLSRIKTECVGFAEQPYFATRKTPFKAEMCQNLPLKEPDMSICNHFMSDVELA